MGKLNLLVQVTRAGSHYRARWQGNRNCVFGASREEAIKRLHLSPSRFLKDSVRNAKIAEQNWAYGFRAAKG